MTEKHCSQLFRLQGNDKIIIKTFYLNNLVDRAAIRSENNPSMAT